MIDQCRSVAQLDVNARQAHSTVEVRLLHSSCAPPPPLLRDRINPRTTMSRVTASRKSVSRQLDRLRGFTASAGQAGGPPIVWPWDQLLRKDGDDEPAPPVWKDFLVSFAIAALVALAFLV